MYKTKLACEIYLLKITIFNNLLNKLTFCIDTMIKWIYNQITVFTAEGEQKNTEQKMFCVFLPLFYGRWLRLSF